MRSQHQGDFWVGTYELNGDPATGTLSSAPFKILHPYASFLIGGGSSDSTRVELVATESPQKVVFKATGPDRENMHPVVADLRSYQGREMFLRIVDEATNGWGHVNFDNFKFHDERPEFANELKVTSGAVN